jgi:phosphoribosylamine--glycine ligase
MLMQRQGSDVVCAFDYTGVKPKELTATEKIGDGLVRKLPLAQATQTLTGQGTIWVFDGNDLPQMADQLREHGEAVIGTSALSQHVEDERQDAAHLAQAVGFDLPQTEQFTDYDRAIAFLEQNKDRAFVFKPDKQDPTMTYVPLEKGDPAKANEELREYLHAIPGASSPSFILQEVVDGIEANIELWLSHGRPVAAFCDLESKRKLVGDLGDNLGCAGDYVFTLPLDSPAIAATVGRYLRRAELRAYTGSVDANVMLKDGKVYFLENCFRFGYNAYPVIFSQLVTQPMEQVLRTWVGGGSLQGAFRDGFGASLTLVCDHPKDGLPILIPTAIHEAVYLYRAYIDTDHVAMVEEWPEVACVTAHGTTMQAAGEQCLALAEQVAFPGKGYRVDLADRDLPTLPISRYEALQRLGLIAGEPDEEAAIAALLGVLA